MTFVSLKIVIFTVKIPMIGRKVRLLDGILLKNEGQR